MDILLERAAAEDAKVLHLLQKAVFQPLLDKYQDFETSPANETMDRLLLRIEHPSGRFFKITAEGKLAGGVRVHWKENNEYWVGPLFIDPAFQGQGIAQETMKLLEKDFSGAASWELATILQEPGNCHLYEKLGYKRTGRSEKVNERMILVYFKKAGGAGI